MPKKSILPKIVFLVLIALIAPNVTTASSAVCEPPYCGPCEGMQYDCTSWWVWNNWQTALFLWYNGYTVVACCE